MNANPWIVPLVAILPALAGCLGLFDQGCETQSGPGLRGHTLRVLDHGAFANFDAIKPLFENRTGAKLVHIAGDDAGGALRQAIQNRGSPIADVIYGVDNLLLQEALDEDIFEPYASPYLANLNENITLAHFQRDGLVYATPVDHAYVSVNYDVALRESGNNTTLPETLEDLADPKWASTFVAENPNLSSPGLAFLAATVATFGEDDDYDYLDYWTDLFDGGILITPGWTEAYVYHYTGGYGKGISSTYLGGRSIVVSYTTSPAVEVLFGAPSPPGVSLEPANGVFHQVETMAILRCTENFALAQAFIDFALTIEFQDTVAPYMAVYPAIRGLDLPREFHDHATDPSELQPAPFNPPADGPKVGKWLQAWTDLYHAKLA